MAARVAPVGVAGAAADGADPEGVVRAGGEVVHAHGAAAGKEAAGLPGAGRAAGDE